MSEKKETPLLMITDMVKATMEGRKTMTRRMKGLERINENPEEWRFNKFVCDPIQTWFTKKGKAGMKELKGFYAEFYHIGSFDEDYTYVKYPYGVVGDLIWVRETWAELTDVAGDSQIVFKAEGGWDGMVKKWKPGIHLEKRYARLWMEVTGIQIERLRDIEEVEAISEGVNIFLPEGKYNPELYECYQCDKGHVGSDNLCDDGFFEDPLKSFESLWKSIHGKKSWEENPWVWVIGFRKMKMVRELPFE